MALETLGRVDKALAMTVFLVLITLALTYRSFRFPCRNNESTHDTLI